VEIVVDAGLGLGFEVADGLAVATELVGPEGLDEVEQVLYYPSRAGCGGL
jgi:hypothetical protein